jgi:hypothetical protein
MRLRVVVPLLAVTALVWSCSSSKNSGRSNAPAISNAHPYPTAIHRHGKTYDAVPVTLKAVMIDKKDPHTLHAFIDLRHALADSGCFGDYWAGGVRRADSSAVVVAAALYVWQPDPSEESQCNLLLSGLPDVRIHLDVPLGSREVIDATTGTSVPVGAEPPH